MDLIEITVRGPTASGKTAIMAVVEAALRDAFNLSVASPHLDDERRARDVARPEGWERPHREKQVVVLTEENVPRTQR